MGRTSCRVVPCVSCGMSTSMRAWGLRWTDGALVAAVIILTVVATLSFFQGQV